MLCLLCISLSIASLLPAAQSDPAVTSLAADIGHLDNLGRLTVEVFNQRTAAARRLLQLTGRFASETDRNEVHKLAVKAREQLESVAYLQDILKTRIENDSTENWNTTYGATGLWRKLHSNLHSTRIDRAEIGLLAALASEPNEIQDRLRKLLGEIESLRQIASPVQVRLLEARTLAELGLYDATCDRRARQIFTDLSKRTDLAESVAFRCTAERILAMGPDDPNEITTLARNLAQSPSANDLQLALSIVCAQLRYGSPESFNETLALFEDLASPVGALLLIDLNNRFEASELNPEDVPETQVELAAASALSTGPAGYARLLRYLASAENLQNPLLLYAAGVALSDPPSPEAVDFLMRSARAQQLHPSARLDIEPSRIAVGASKLAYNIFVSDRSRQDFALQTFESYLRIEPNQPDPEVQYLQATVLRHASRPDEADALLESISSNAEPPWRYRAELDLIKKHILSGASREPGENSTEDRLDYLLKQIAPKTADNPLYLDTAVTLSRLLLDSEDRTRAGKALEILNGFKDIQDTTLIVLKARALRNQGNLDTSLHYLLMACQAEPKHIPLAMDALAGLIDDLDRLANIHPRFADIVRSGLDLARYCHGKLKGQDRSIASLYLAELYIFMADSEPHYLPNARSLLDEFPDKDPPATPLLRCRARILTQEQNYPAAAALWARIAEAYRLNETPAERSPDFWRAKFFELHCLALCPQPPHERIAHAIEVLEKSFEDIPLTWSTRLAALKNQCRDQNARQT